MNTIPMQLVAFVRNSLNPQKFIAQHFCIEDFYRWRNFMVEQVDSLTILLSTNSFDDKEMEKIITQVVDLSNTINSYIFRKFRFIRSHAQSGIINEHYIFTLDLLDGLTLTLNTLFPIPAGKVKISDSFLFDTLIALKKEFYKLTLHLRNSKVEGELANVILLGLSKLIHKKY